MLNTIDQTHYRLDLSISSINSRPYVMHYISFQSLHSCALESECHLTLFFWQDLPPIPLAGLPLLIYSLDFLKKKPTNMSEAAVLAISFNHYH